MQQGSPSHTTQHASMPFTCFPVVPAKCLASQLAMQNQPRFIICGILFLKRYYLWYCQCQKNTRIPRRIAWYIAVTGKNENIAGICQLVYGPGFFGPFVPNPSSQPEWHTKLDSNWAGRTAVLNAIFFRGSRWRCWDGYESRSSSSESEMGQSDVYGKVKLVNQMLNCLVLIILFVSCRLVAEVRTIHCWRVVTSF